MNSRKNLTLKSKKIIRVGITVGDPAGIGPEITAKALKILRNYRSAEFIIIGQKNKAVKLGRVSALHGELAISYINKAVQLYKDGSIDCLVTCPVSKEAINLAGYKFSGHTEYLAGLTNTKEYLMLLLNKYFKFGMVTRHLALKDVPLKLNRDNVYRAIILTHNAVKELFGITHPRLTVLGLNPHASDNGLLGKEELNIIAPAIKKAQRTIKHIDGPMPADCAILDLMRGKFDAAVAMYHDQALIPLKLSDVKSGVNLTYGLPFVRTSPLHGTAFDIAGKNKADPSSLIAAIKFALTCCQNQKNA